jgi:chromate transporter
MQATVGKSADTSCTRRRMTGYFLHLGLTGFGGPVALANHMRNDLVDMRGWLKESEYEDGLAIATACPGPLAYQLGVYCGYVRFGIAGALLVAIAFALAPFLIVTLISALYLRYAQAWEVRAIFYGVAPVITALILKACWSLGRKTLKANRRAWLLALGACTVTLVFRQELVSLFAVAGLLGVSLFRPAAKAVSPDKPATSPPGNAHALAVLLLQSPSLKLFLFFLKTGLLVFGSGLVIAPFLKAYVVDDFHWLTDRQFIDAVSVGMVTPGPVVITATFVGYHVAGFWGGVAATLGIFLPAVIFTIFAAPLLQRFRANPYVQGFIQGITTAVIGALAGTTVLVAESAVGDLFTASLAAVGFVATLRWQKLPDALLVGISAVLGLLGFAWLQPTWLA